MLNIKLEAQISDIFTVLSWFSASAPLERVPERFSVAVTTLICARSKVSKLVCLVFSVCVKHFTTISSGVYSCETTVYARMCDLLLESTVKRLINPPQHSELRHILRTPDSLWVVTAMH